MYLEDQKVASLMYKRILKGALFLFVPIINIGNKPERHSRPRQGGGSVCQ